MKNIVHSLYIYFLLFFIACNAPQEKTRPYQPVTPESLGISSEAILEFIEAAEKERPDELHSFILMRHGKVAAQGWWDPYNPQSPHMLYSLSKSFASTAIGLAQEEGLLSIDDPVISFFPDETPLEVSPNLKAMRIRDLLKMNTGHNADATYRMQQDPENWVRGFLSLDVEHKPGTHFVYNSAATFMLSAIIQKVTGETLLQYLTPRLFEPLGIENPTWETNPQGINMGGWGLSIRTEDIAKFGQLYLQEGMWKGEQLVPEEWVREATSYQTSNGSNPESDWEQGYGYQFWRCRHNLYRGDGAFGQYCIVMPEQDAVIAITSGTSDMQSIMNLVWDHLLPAMEPEPLNENGPAYNALKDKLSALSLTRIEGTDNAELAVAVSENSYALEPDPRGIEKIDFSLDGKDKAITLIWGSGSATFPLGSGDHEDSMVIMPMLGQQPVASSGGWISENSYQVRIYLYETPYYFNYLFTFDGDELVMDGGINVSFGGSEPEPVRGKAVTEELQY